MKKIIITAAALAFAGQAHAGGRLETFEANGIVENGFNHVVAVGMFWDKRCASVPFVLDDIPANAGALDEIPASTMASELQAAFDAWNDIPTSYIDMNINRVEALNNSFPRFDFINELSMIGGFNLNFLAFSQLFSLNEDETFIAGTDFDGDGDADVFDPAVVGSETCTDFDNDGDNDFPAGVYKAGTIIDNNVWFNDNLATIDWNLVPETTPTGQVSKADLRAVATHEFGHSHGLSHSGINQISSQDGSGATMFWVVQFNVAEEEAAVRTLYDDDIAWSSYVYPEGSDTTGIAALQSGDIAFDDVYYVIEGTVTEPDHVFAGQSFGPAGVYGAGIRAKALNTDRIVGETFSGQAYQFQRASDGLCCFTDPVASILLGNGDYKMPLPIGTYDLSLQSHGINAPGPIPSSAVNNTGFIGFNFGNYDFAEEYLGSISLEDHLEDRPGLSVPIAASASNGGIHHDFFTNVDVVLRNGTPRDLTIAVDLAASPDVKYAVRFANSDVLALLQDGAILTTGLPNTTIASSTVVPVYKRVLLTLGTVSVDGQTATIDLANPIRAKSDFVGGQDSLTPYYFGEQGDFNGTLKELLIDNPDKDVFLVLEGDPNAQGSEIGLFPSVTVDINPPFGQSFTSVNGGTFAVESSRNWPFELRFTPAEE